MEEDALFISRSWTAATDAAVVTLPLLLPLLPLPTPLLLPTPPPPPASRGRGPVTEESQPRGEEVERRPLKALSLLLLLLLAAAEEAAAEGTRPLLDMCSVQDSAEPTFAFRS